MTTLLRTLILTALSMGFELPSYCQSRVTGHVFDENDRPFPGVNIVAKGTPTGTSTDMQGAFSISTLPTATLVFSFIGYHTAEVEIKNRQYVSVKLMPDLQDRKFTSIYVPSLSGLFIDDFPALQTNAKRMSAVIRVKFNDNTSKSGEGVLIGYHEDQLLFLSAVDLFYSIYNVPLKEILIEFQGKRDIEGRVFLLPDSVKGMNPDLAVVAINAEHFADGTELLFSNKDSKTYFANLANRRLMLSLAKTNELYQELYFETNENPTLFLGAPIFDKYGVAGLIVDNIGHTLIATQTARSLSVLQENAVLSRDTINPLFNTHKYSKRLNTKKFKPVGLYLGFNFTSNSFNGADLLIKNSAFTPSLGVFVATNFLGFDLSYEASYNYVESKPLNAAATYVRLRNTHYGHSFLLEKSIFHVGRTIFSFAGAISYFKFSGVVFNSLEQEIPLEAALGKDIDSNFKSFAVGFEIEYPRFVGDRIGIFSRILFVNTNTSYLDVNINDLANSSTDHDKMLKVQIGCSFRLF